jgi:hypothetical protein
VSGTYTVVVDNQFNLDATGTYQFKIWDVPAPVVTPIAIDQVVSGSLDIPGSRTTTRSRAPPGSGCSSTCS